LSSRTPVTLVADAVRNRKTALKALPTTCVVQRRSCQPGSITRCTRARLGKLSFSITGASIGCRHCWRRKPPPGKRGRDEHGALYALRGSELGCKARLVREQACTTRSGAAVATKAAATTSAFAESETSGQKFSVVFSPTARHRSAGAVLG
jgi:hypothetical protein